MNINDLMIMTSLNSVPTASPAAPTAADGFQDLLSIVGDMQVADAQGTQQNDLIDSSLQEMKSEPQLKAQIEMANLQLMPQVMNGPSIGLPNDVSEEMPSRGVMVAASSIVSSPAVLSNSKQSALVVDNADALDLAQKAQVVLASKGGEAQAMDPNAVAEWSRAFLADDIKKVEVGPVAPKNAELLAEVAMPTSELPQIKEAQRAVTPKSVERPFDFGQKASSAPEAFVAWSANSDSRSAMSSPGPDMGLGEKAARPSKSTSPKGAEAMSGADFVLGQSLSGRGVEAKAANSALVASASLGDAGDRRISADSVNFVADKIESLKAQGGGQLKVALNPNELGSVEIRVSINKQGLLDVKLLAERPSTMSALNEVKSELTTKLASIRPTQIDVQSLEVGLSARSDARSVAHLASSQDMLTARAPVSSGSNLREMSAVRSDVMPNAKADFGLGNTVTSLETNASPRAESMAVRASESSASSEGFASGWNRDERRERARHQWEESFKERQSA